MSGAAASPGGAEVVGLDHVQLAAPPGCERAARAFHAGVLGMTERPKPAALAARGGCWFTAGAAELHLGVEDGFRPARKAHPALRVAPGASEALAARLSAAGAVVAWDDRVPHTRRFHTTDPFGNRLEFTEGIQPPRSGFGPR
ncbi:glyoxalase [Streptomyces tubbatahanensis]|uniref:Glyoxalase n=1 Tax=Streptomyces tubbatahanensis TaxID=2923272 RepID=A0ABY3XST9_9ACTN|nr:VOC family protein [Streptomyces tubbatahanensis]UNS97449.1 glyoxalase [Streptomyces tubbatahanensis]